MPAQDMCSQASGMPAAAAWFQLQKLLTSHICYQQALADTCSCRMVRKGSLMQQRGHKGLAIVSTPRGMGLQRWS
jgi:hypothetical protein